MKRTFSIFVSSVQKELADERRALKDYLTRDPLLGRFFPDVFLFEDLPAQDRRPDEIYLGEIGERDIYLGIWDLDLLVRSGVFGRLAEKRGSHYVFGRGLTQK